MGADTKIEYVERTVNFWMGCEPVSEGCEHCYARYFWRLHGMKPGERRRASDKTIRATLRKAKPGDFVFVNSLSDFFDPAGAQWRAHALDIMVSRRDLTFLLLTKRPEHIAEAVCGAGSGITHIWLGVTAENQARADERIPQLLEIDWPGKKVVSIEPMLGPVEFRLRGMAEASAIRDWLRGGYAHHDSRTKQTYRHEINWVILGGETGAQARPMKPEWVRSVRDQCVEAGVPFFFKAWGGKKEGAVLDGREWKERPRMKGIGHA